MIDGIRQYVTGVRNTLGTMVVTMDRMNAEVQAMSHDMGRMAQPARSFNKMFPFP